MRFHRFLLPLYLLLCIVLGGSSQSNWGALVLQLLALAIIGWVLIAPTTIATRHGRPLLAILAFAFGLVLIQLVPLPPGIWTVFPGREPVKLGYETLGQAAPWLPISFAPYSTLETMLLVLPAAAVLIAALRLKSLNVGYAAAAIAFGAILSVLLGFAQIQTGGTGQSDWYLYEVTNIGSAVGFFANRNHMGTLLLIAVPFIIALFFRRRTTAGKHFVPLMIVGSASLLVILMGVLMNGSLAALVLAVPVATASLLMVTNVPVLRIPLIAITAAGIFGSIVFLTQSPVQPKLTGETTASFEGRWQIWTNAVEAIDRTFPVGTGIGTFERIYASVEPRGDVSNVYVNHAHNDYLQVVVEGGLPAAALVVMLLVWWARRAAQIFSGPHSERWAMAATVASAAILLHEIVDYPLRTIAVSTVFALCVAIMAKAYSAAPTSGVRVSVNAAGARQIHIGD